MNNAEPVTAGQFVAEEIRSFRNDIRGLSVTPSLSSAELAQRLAPYTFDGQVPLVEALGDVASLLRHSTLHATHPRYFGLFVPGTTEAGIWADALAALFNPQLGAAWHAPAATAIETHTLAFLAEVLGVEARTAHFTSGGSEANLTALLAAVAYAYPSAREAGVGAAARHAVVYLSSEAHHSLHKAIRIVGLGDRALRIIPCNAAHQLDIAALRESVAHDVAAGRRPLLIVGTIGTTTAGAIDDLGAIGAIARVHGCWFHVDAAWGGAAGFSSSLRHLLGGIRAADSVTWDAHKWLSVPMGAAMFFSRHEGVLREFFDVDATYVPRQSPDGDLYRSTLQWSRRFIGLKVFLTLATQGRHGIEARIVQQLDAAQHLRDRLMRNGWRLVNDSPLPIVCFTHRALADEQATAALAQEVERGGRAWLSAASLPEGPVLRACITHDETSRADVDVLCEELERALHRWITRNRTSPET